MLSSILHGKYYTPPPPKKIMEEGLVFLFLVTVGDLTKQGYSNLYCT